MAYTTVNKSSLHMNNKLYTGNGSTGHSITGVGFKPDIVWAKARSEGEAGQLYDSTRGVTKRLFTHDTEQEETVAQGLTAFGTDGFTLGSANGANKNSQTYVAWNWKANGGTTSSNSDGSITSTVQANTTAGFSIVQYTGTGSVATVGHGLGKVPKTIWVKKTSGQESWGVYHNSIGNTHFLQLNTTGGDSNNDTFWNDTTPTSSVFTIKSDAGVNGSGATYIAYCWADITGFSKFGTYKGNGNADGSFIYCGFKPSWLMIKRSDATDSWFMYDNKRSPFNEVDDYLVANAVTAETTTSSVDLDLLSTGFKLRNTDGGHNNSGSKYVYWAFGQSLVGSNNIPCTAK